MKNDEWIDSNMACAALGVRAQTLYAYVSRKLIRACSDRRDARRSLYSRWDVEALANRSRRPRARLEVAANAIRWGDPVLDTAVSGVRDGTLYFGSRSALECATDMTVEQIAQLHWQTPVAISNGSCRAEYASSSPFERAVLWLAENIASDAPMLGRSREQIAIEGGKLLSGVTNAILGRAVAGPIHARVAQVWNLDNAQSETVRSALVLLSDHDLNPSTFAVRICASTGASLTAAIMAGMATLSGPRHGGVAPMANQALRASMSGPVAMQKFLDENAELDPYAYGYGHPLYPAGDPRGAFLLAMLPRESSAVRGIENLSKRLGIPPNIDGALAACVAELGLPENAAFSIFAIGRLTGWIAHAMEQSQSRQMIRPRARFTGSEPVSAAVTRKAR